MRKQEKRDNHNRESYYLKITGDQVGGPRWRPKPPGVTVSWRDGHGLVRATDGADMTGTTDAIREARVQTSC